MSRRRNDPAGGVKKGKRARIIAEFKEFIMRGNVLDLAIGVILATAFGKITSSLVSDVFMPLFGLVTGSYDLSKLNILLRGAYVRDDGTEVPELTLGLGGFISTVIDFILIAVFVFLLVKGFNKAKSLLDAKKQAEEKAEEEKTESSPTTEELLSDILAELRKNNTEHTERSENAE